MAASYHPVSHADSNYELAPADHDGDRISPEPSSQPYIDVDRHDLGGYSDNERGNSPVRNEKSTTRKSLPRGVLHRNGTSQHTLILKSRQPATYSLERYIPRSLLNTVGPCLLLAFYIFIVSVYLLRPPINGIVPYYPIRGKGVFFAWLILSIFVLDWAKSGLAGLEAWALMEPRFAPRNGMQLVWHADRSWGSLSGWWKATKVLYNNARHALPGSFAQERRHGPGRLWWYLALSSFLIYAAVPLAGLSMDPSDAKAYSNVPVTLFGTNQSFFDFNGSNSIAMRAKNRWIQGLTTTPQSPSVLYGPEGGNNGSATYLQDVLTAAYHRDLNATTDPGTEVTFFSAPQASSTVYGNAWGITTQSRCAMVHFKDLTMVKVNSINDWRITQKSWMNNLGPNNYTDTILTMQGLAESPVAWLQGYSRGVDYQILAASNMSAGNYTEYTNASTFPNGLLEFVLWQGYDEAASVDPEFRVWAASPFVVNDTWAQVVQTNLTTNTTNYITMLGYALQCSIKSATGVANLDARYNTFSDFKPQATKPAPAWSVPGSVSAYPGIVSLSTLMWAAWTSVVLQTEAPPSCSPSYTSFACDPWYSVNAATNGNPMLTTRGSVVGAVQLPSIAPARFKLAMQKLLGECAIAVMATGPGEWVGDLRGLKHASAIVPGAVPWPVVLPLLVFWTVVTVLPSVLTFGQRRWAATLDGFQLFRLGAEWKDSVWAFTSRKPEANKSLLDMPGLVGEMDAWKTGASGFIGLSQYSARRTGTFVYDRSLVKANVP